MEGQKDSFAPARFFQEGRLPLLPPPESAAPELRWTPLTSATAIFSSSSFRDESTITPMVASLGFVLIVAVKMLLIAGVWAHCFLVKAA